MKHLLTDCGRRPAALAFAMIMLAVVTGRTQETTTLRFADPMLAMINARHWDETHQQWLGELPEEPYFDAVHRFLLVRFPGSAAAIHEKLAKGWEVASVRLVLNWTGQEWQRRQGDFQHRGWGLPENELARWHARVWLLRRPWTADPEIGPTWNAYINGAGWWRRSGALAAGVDRLGESPGRVEVSGENPVGELEVTAALGMDALGDTVAARLRTLEACGFLIHKDEIANPEYGDNFMSTGNLRITIQSPELAVVLRRSEARPEALPPPVDVAVLAAELRAAAGDGLPASRMPENLKSLSRALTEQPAGMPDWMWARVREVGALAVPRHPRPQATDYAALLSGDPERYLTYVDEIMRRPPAWFMGHSHMDMILPLLAYDAILPEALRYHLGQYALARWQPELAHNEWRWGVASAGRMATLNHQSQFRGEALIAGELLGLSDLVVGAQASLDLLTRQMIFSEGSIQEKGDTFYLGISLAGIQAVARFSENPLYRLKASLAVEKMLFDANLTYHPGLRRRVSRIARLYRLNDFLLAQDVPEAALHTLSQAGVLIETDQPEVHGIPTLNLHATRPERVAALAPWGAAWEHHVTDGKALPFTYITTDYVRALAAEPIYEVTHMGRQYALASKNADIGNEWPVSAAWRRHDRQVEHFAELGFMFPWGYVNDTPANRVHAVERALPMNMATATLQHENTMLYAMTPPERAFMEPRLKDGLRNLYSRVSIYAFGPDDERELWVNGTRIEQFPHPARHGDVITLRDGVTFLGLIPLPATDLGRQHEVLIRYEHPHLTLDSYVLDRDEPLALADETWQALDDVVAGWVVQLGDAAEHASFAAFREHLRGAELQSCWEPEARTWHLAYANGKDTLEMGFRTDFERTEAWQPLTPSMVMAYQRVNGQWPWPDRRLDSDSPLGQMGTVATLAKGGATLTTTEGQMAMLRVEPLSGTYVGINPFIDPQPFTLITPEGVIVRAEGSLGLARVTVQPGENILWVDYQLPPADGDRGAEIMQERARAGERAGWQIETPLVHYYPEDRDVRLARRRAARALLVAGLAEPPRVILNGAILPGSFARFTEAGRTWHRIPIAK